MQKFTVTIHMNVREYKDGVRTETRGIEEYEGLTAQTAASLALQWMTGPDMDNVTIAIVAE